MCLEVVVVFRYKRGIHVAIGKEESSVEKGLERDVRCCMPDEIQTTAYIIAVDVEEARELAYRLIGKQLQYVAYVLVESDQITVLYSGPTCQRCSSSQRYASCLRRLTRDSCESTRKHFSPHGFFAWKKISAFSFECLTCDIGGFRPPAG